MAYYQHCTLLAHSYRLHRYGIRVDGEWTQDSELLYSRNMLGQYDGGHGMLFYDTDGQMYLSIHSPNSVIGNRKETPVFIPVREQNGTLVWDIWKGE